MNQGKLMNRTVLTLAIVGSLVLLNILAVRFFTRVDLTSDGRYTLSDASKRTMAQLDDVITVTAYFTKDLPAPWSSNARYVRDLLAEYHAASGGKLRFEFLDPREMETEEDKETKKEVKRDIFGRAFREATSVEQELASLGIQPVEIPHIQEDKQQFMRAYMGIVVRHGEKKEAIPVVQRVDGLEYHLTSMIRRMTRQEQPVLGILQSHGAPALGEKLTQLQAVLSQTYEVRPVDLSAKDRIDDDVASLWVIGPKESLDQKALRAIDQFLMRGGSAAFFLDTVQVDARTFSPEDAHHGLGALLQTYGVKLGDALVADAQSAAITIQERRGFMLVAQQVPYAFLPVVERMEPSSAVTKGLGGVSLPFATEVTAQAPEDGSRQVSVLARSSEKSWLEPRPFNLDPRREWRPASLTGPHPLMVQVSGKLPSHFAAEANMSTPDAPQGERLTESRGESRIVVAGTSSWLWDGYAQRPNLVLAANIADWLALDPALVAIRNRGYAGTPLKAEVSDSVRNGVKFGNTLGIPLLLVGFGLVRWRMREARRRTVTV